MMFLSLSIPKPSEGLSFVGIEDQVVPDQSLSLDEIIERFVRGEALPVGKEASWDEDADESEVDLEKLKYEDLTVQTDYIQEMKHTQERYDREENEREQKRKDADEQAAKLAEEKRIRIAARKLARQKSPSPPIVP